MVFKNKWSLIGGYYGLFNQGGLLGCDIYLQQGDLYSEGVLIHVCLWVWSLKTSGLYLEIAMFYLITEECYWDVTFIYRVVFILRCSLIHVWLYMNMICKNKWSLFGDYYVLFNQGRVIGMWPLFTGWSLFGGDL